MWLEGHNDSAGYQNWPWRHRWPTLRIDQDDPGARFDVEQRCMYLGDAKKLTCMRPALVERGHAILPPMWGSPTQCTTDDLRDGLLRVEHVNTTSATTVRARHPGWFLRWAGLWLGWSRTGVALVAAGVVRAL